MNSRNYVAGLAIALLSLPGLAIEQEAYLKASNTESPLDYFAWAVAISGDTLVVGAWGEDSAAVGVNGNQNDNSSFGAGAAYVFTRMGTTWSQQAYLKASNTGQSVRDDIYHDSFGDSVAISEDTIIVGAPHEDGGARGVNGDGNNDSAINSGAAYIFTRTGTTWSQQAYLKASNAEGSVPIIFNGKIDGWSGDGFGSTVAISGDTVVVGAPSEAGNGDPNDNSARLSGAAYVFTRNGTTWAQQAYLKASNPESGAYFGWSVAISGDTIVVGAQTENSGARGVNGNPADSRAPGAGAAYVFQRNGTTWTQQAYLKASNPESGDSFGRSVSIDGDTIAIGSQREDSAATGMDGDQTNNSARDSGAVYLFQRVGSTWTQQAYLKASRSVPGLGFGYSVSLSENLLAVGVAKEDSSATGVNGDQDLTNARNAGAAYVFTRQGNTWKQQAYLKASNTGIGDLFGQSVAASGKTVVIGAVGEKSAATGVNGNQSDESVGSAGAAYVFTGFERPVSLTPIERWRQQHFGITTNTGEAANVADPDRDGLANLIEYGLVTSPTIGQADGPFPSTKRRDGERYLIAAFRRDPSRDDVTLRVETAGDLAGPWSIVASSVKGAATTGLGLVSETDLDGLKQLEVRDTVPVTSAASRFFRLSVEE